MKNFFIFGTSFFLFLNASSAGAQTCQSDELKEKCKMVTFTMAAAEGGGTGTMIRFIAEKFSQAGIPNKVEALPAGNGFPATRKMKDNTNPCNIFVGSNSNISLNALNPAFQPKIDIQTHFEPVSLVTTTPFVLACNKDNETDFKPQNAKELLQGVRTKSLTMGTAGVGSVSHLVVAQLKAALNPNWEKDRIADQNVPYSGSTPAQLALASGQVVCLAESPVTIGTAVKSKPDKMFLVGSTHDGLAKVNGIPVMPLNKIDDQLKNFVFKPYIGVLATKGAGAAHKSLFEKFIKCAVTGAEFKEKFESFGYPMTDGSAQALGRLLDEYKEGGRINSMLDIAAKMDKMITAGGVTPSRAGTK